MQNRTVKSKRIADQSLYDVFEDFYRLGNGMDENQDEHATNYATIRLVTILEQFCRCVVEVRLEKSTGQIPQNIVIKHQLLDDLVETVQSGAGGDVKNAIIAMSYMFQDVHAICGEMKNFGLINERDGLKEKIMELEPLFQARHALVHSVEPSMLSAGSIAAYRDKVEDVMRGILDALDMPMYDFDILKGHAFREMAMRAYLKGVPDIEDVKELDDVFANMKSSGEPRFARAKEFYDISIACFDSALERFLAKASAAPLRLDILSEIVWTYKIKGDLRNAGKYADILLKSSPKDAVACYCMGLYLLSINRPAAIKQLKKAADGETYIPGTHAKTIEIFLEGGNTEHTLFYADQAIEIEPDDPVLYVLKSKALRQLNLHGYAETCYTIGGEQAVKFVENRRNGAVDCAGTLRDLRKHDRYEIVVKYGRIFKKRFCA